MEEAATGIRSVSPELEAIVVETLIHYWVERGLTQNQATVAAQNAIIRLRTNVSNETWCLLPQLSRVETA